MQQPRSETAITSRLYAWATYYLRARLRTMRPIHTTEQIAAVVAATGNPAGT